ncbi:MAG TPA: hypothetical protein VK009_12865 [Chloroflexota bacterium]|nr:hypothetical protein [Chloroflexota bacterium]
MSDERELLAGIAVNGPWQGFIEEARNPKKRHYAWGYSLRTDVSPDAAEALKSGDRKRRIKNGTKVYLACWEPGKDGVASIFRIGYVDYIRRDGHFVSFAFHLDDLVELEVPVAKDQLLLRYVDPAEIRPAGVPVV